MQNTQSGPENRDRCAVAAVSGCLALDRMLRKLSKIEVGEGTIDMTKTQKAAWQTPKLNVLDVERTLSGGNPTVFEGVPDAVGGFGNVPRGS